MQGFSFHGNIHFSMVKITTLPSWRAHFIATFHVPYKSWKMRNQYLNSFVQKEGEAKATVERIANRLSIMPRFLYSYFFPRYNAICNTNGHRPPSADHELMRSYSHQLAREDMQRLLACQSGASQSEPYRGFSTASENRGRCNNVPFLA